MASSRRFSCMLIHTKGRESFQLPGCGLSLAEAPGGTGGRRGAPCVLAPAPWLPAPSGLVGGFPRRLLACGGGHDDSRSIDQVMEANLRFGNLPERIKPEHGRDWTPSEPEFFMTSSLSPKLCQWFSFPN